MSTYYKIHQRNSISHYIKLLDDREPKAVQVINFLNLNPHIDFYEFNLNDPGSLIEYQAIIEDAILIEESEYIQAYRLATTTKFEVYVDGRKLQSE